MLGRWERSCCRSPLALAWEARENPEEEEEEGDDPKHAGTSQLEGGDQSDMVRRGFLHAARPLCTFV